MSPIWKWIWMLGAWVGITVAAKIDDPWWASLFPSVLAGFAIALSWDAARNERSSQ
jgi:hypothetical protein